MQTQQNMDWTLMRVRVWDTKKRYQRGNMKGRGSAMQCNRHHHHHIFWMFGCTTIILHQPYLLHEYYCLVFKYFIVVLVAINSAIFLLPSLSNYRRRWTRTDVYVYMYK